MEDSSILQHIVNIYYNLHEKLICFTYLNIYLEYIPRTNKLRKLNTSKIKNIRKISIVTTIHQF